MRKYIIESKPVRFEGNGYSKEWREEAARRGLSTEVDCIPALKAYCSEKAKRLFVDNGILSERELEARFEIKNEIYLKKLQIESVFWGSRVESYYPDGDHLPEHAVDECDRFEEYPAGLRVRGRRANRGYPHDFLSYPGDPDDGVRYDGSSQAGQCDCR